MYTIVDVFFCMHAHTVRMYVCTVCDAVHTYACVYGRMYVCAEVFGHVRICTYIRTYVRMYVCTYVRTYVYTYVHTYV